MYPQKTFFIASEFFKRNFKNYSQKELKTCGLVLNLICRDKDCLSAFSRFRSERIPARDQRKKIFNTLNGVIRRSYEEIFNE